MRVRITFKLKNRGNYLPFYHQHLFSQLIKGMIVASGDSTYQNFDLFSFSGLKGLTRVGRQGLQYNSNRVSLVISSNDKAFIDYLLFLFFQRKSLSVGALVLEPEYVEKEDSPTFNNVTKLICLSPIVVLQAQFQDEESKRFINPVENEFSDLLFDHLLQQMEKDGIKADAIEDYHKFQLVPDVEYLEKIKRNGKKFSRVYSLYDQDLGYDVRGYTIPFELYAPPAIQEFIFNCGLGNYTHKGFGMVDLAHVDPLSRTSAYDIPEKLKELISA